MYCELPKVNRCCFFLPLRRGLLIFGYLNMHCIYTIKVAWVRLVMLYQLPNTLYMVKKNILFSGLFLILYSCRLHSLRTDEKLRSQISFDDIDLLGLYISDVLYFIDTVFSVVLIYGAHREIVRFLKVYYYYLLVALSMTIVLNIYYINSQPRRFVKFLTLSFTRCCFYIYPIILLSSLVEKLENKSGHTYENQLQEIIAGEIKRDNTVYPSLPTEIVEEQKTRPL